MSTLSRHAFWQTALACSATAAWARRVPAPSRRPWREQRELYPEGVASGDPDEHSVLLWTQQPLAGQREAVLTVELAEDEAFQRVVAEAQARLSALSDWTCRVLVGRLQPRRTYWYRFTDASGGISCPYVVCRRRTSSPDHGASPFIPS